MPSRRRTKAAIDSSASGGAGAMKGSRRSRSLATSENAGVARKARGDIGSAMSLPPRTMNRVAATALASARSPRMPSASSSSLMSGVVSSALFGPVS